MAITAEQINQAATEIAANGKRPTVALVRAQIGAGSFTTITPFLRDWSESQAPPSVSATASEPAPQQLVDCLLSVAPQIWAIAADVANVHLTNERNAIANERIDLQLALSDCNATGDIISADLEKSQKKVLDITAEMSQIVATYTTETTNYCDARIASDLAVAVINATNGQLQTRLDDQIAINHEIRAGFDASNIQISVLNTKIANITTDHVLALAEQVNALIAVEKALAVLDSTHGHLQYRFDEQIEINNELKIDRDKFKERVAALSADVARITAAHVVDITEHSNARISAEHTVSVFNATNSQLQLRIDELHGHNADLKYAVDNLTAELKSINANMVVTSRD
jgi:regulator of replication initiation timing